MSESTALTVTQRAVVALGLTEETAKELTELAGRTVTITAITNTDGYQQVHAGRMALKNRRIEIEKMAKVARQDATDFSKACIAQEKRFIGITQPEEDRLQRLQDAYDATIAAEKQARIDAEIKRVADLQERVRELAGNQTLTSLTDPTLIAEHISDLGKLVVDESFEEFRERAVEVKATALARLQALYCAALDRVKEAERAKAEREELTKLRAEQAERDRVERARIAEEERVAKAARDAETARHAAELKAQRQKQEAEAAVERQRIADERAELERQQEEFRKSQAPIVLETPKPTDADIIALVASHWGVDDGQAVEWILAMDFSKLSIAA